MSEHPLFPSLPLLPASTMPPLRPFPALHAHKPPHLIQTIKVALRGGPLLASPRFNKGTAFPPSERTAFGLHGRLPYRKATLEEQVERAYGQLSMRDDPLRKNTFLQSLKEQNWTLYYALIAKHLKELVPVIYTPTQGDAIAQYSHLFRRPDGLFLAIPDKDDMEAQFLEQTKGRDIDLVVVTDSEAILGIGDQGVGGIGISIAKSAMYTLVGGLDPSKTLAVVLDVGTNNETLLSDPLYVGWRHHRVTGEEYDEFVDKFVQLVRKHYPHSLLHFEDFGTNNAYRLLQKYREKHAAFNDDIQGTGAVTLACIMAALGVSSRSSSSKKTALSQSDRLADQRYIIFGAGSAGMGIAVQLRDAMVTADGLTRAEANKRFWLIDREGLLYDRSEEGREGTHQHAWANAKEEFVRDFEEGWGADFGFGNVGLLDVVKKVKPTVLIGCSTAAGAFTEEVVKAMCEGLTNGEKPIIMPLSNPSRLVEAHPRDIMQWTEGRALVATGSPFGAVEVEVGGVKKKFKIAECNNALIYPGLGFGAILCKSRCVTDTMLIEGAKKLAGLSPAIQVAHATPKEEQYEYDGESLLPDFGAAPGVNFEIGIAVAQQAVLEGTADEGWAPRGGVESFSNSEVRDLALEEVKGLAEEKVWIPVYNDYVYDPEGLVE